MGIIKIKKPGILCAPVYSDLVNRAQNADPAVRTCERFVYLIVNLTRFYETKHGVHIFGEIYKLCNGLWAFFLDCVSGADWLDCQTPIT